MDKAIVTCAITGVLTDPKVYPAPVTPEQMAAESKAAFDEGASVIHVHFRRLEPGQGHLPSWQPEVAEAVVAAIRAACPGVIVNQTTGTVGPDISGALACIAAVKPEIAALNAGSLNYLKTKSDGDLGLAADAVRQSCREDRGLPEDHAANRSDAGIRMFRHRHRAHRRGHRAQLRLRARAQI